MINRVFPVSAAFVSQLTLTILVGVVVTAPAYSAPPSPQPPPLYKWVEESGEVRYSDHLPSSQAKEGFQKVTPSGRVIVTKEKAKPPEVLREERATKRRQEEAARIQAEVDRRVAAMNEHHDNVLMMTFTNEEEITVAQDERLAVIDSVIRLLRKNIKTEQEKLKKEEDRAKRLYLDKNVEVPGGQAQKIEYFTEKVLTKQLHLNQKLEERKKVKEQYIKDLIRYRELTIIKAKQEKAKEEERRRLKEESYYK